MNVRWWFTLEQFERDLAKRRGKIIGMSGPVLEDTDESFRDEFIKDEMFVAKATFKIPKAYWKLIISKEKKNLEYCAFILDEYLLEKLTKTKEFKLSDHMVTLRTLEQKTGLIFLESLHNLKYTSEID